MNANETELVERAARGDANAFNILLGANEQRMYAVALRICGNPEDAKDCLQDAMVRVFRAIGDFKGQSAFSTWLYRIVTNTCLDALRRRKKQNSTSLDALVDEGWSPAQTGGRPEQKLERKELRNELSKAIQSLPDEMRTAIVLRDVQGCSYEEIADALNINLGTVKSRISRGREKLRGIIRNSKELFGM